MEASCQETKVIRPFLEKSSFLSEKLTDGWTTDYLALEKLRCLSAVRAKTTDFEKMNFKIVFNKIFLHKNTSKDIHQRNIPRV